MPVISAVNINDLAVKMEERQDLLIAAYQASQEIIHKVMKQYVSDQGRALALSSVELAAVQVKLAENQLLAAKKAASDARSLQTIKQRDYLQKRGFDLGLAPSPVLKNMLREERVKIATSSIEGKYNNLTK